jgi:hypothetical protein
MSLPRNGPALYVDADVRFFRRLQISSSAQNPMIFAMLFG